MECRLVKREMKAEVSWRRPRGRQLLEDRWLKAGIGEEIHKCGGHAWGEKYCEWLRVVRSWSAFLPFAISLSSRMARGRKGPGTYVMQCGGNQQGFSVLLQACTDLRARSWPRVSDQDPSRTLCAEMVTFGMRVSAWVCGEECELRQTVGHSTSRGMRPCIYACICSSKEQYWTL